MKRVNSNKLALDVAYSCLISPGFLKVPNKKAPFLSALLPRRREMIVEALNTMQYNITEVMPSLAPATAASVVACVVLLIVIWSYEEISSIPGEFIINACTSMLEVIFLGIFNAYSYIHIYWEIISISYI